METPDNASRRRRWRLRRPARLDLILYGGVAFVAVATAGCSVAGFGSLTSVLFGLVLSLLFVGAACSERTPAGGGDGTVVSDGGRKDARSSDGGSWERCCQGGTISTCWCPGNASCNYGWFTECGNGTCTLGGSCDDGGVDAGADKGVPGDVGVADKGAGDKGTPGDIGTAADSSKVWLPCCKQGQISTCYCPPGAACNYIYQDCGGGTCVLPGTSCTPDAGPPDSGTKADAGAADSGTKADAATPKLDASSSDAGSWQTCCQSNVISTCWCPANVACNYGWFQSCGNGKCTFPGGTCP